MLGNEVRIIAVFIVIRLVIRIIALVMVGEPQKLLRQPRPFEVAQYLEQVEVVKSHGKQ